MTDEELLEYISESSTMSKAMDEYDGKASSHALISHTGHCHCTQDAGLHGATCKLISFLSSVLANDHDNDVASTHLCDS